LKDFDNHELAITNYLIDEVKGTVKTVKKEKVPVPGELEKSTAAVEKAKVEGKSKATITRLEKEAADWRKALDEEESTKEKLDAIKAKYVAIKANKKLSVKDLQNALQEFVRERQGAIDERRENENMNLDTVRYPIRVLEEKLSYLKRSAIPPEEMNSTYLAEVLGVGRSEQSQAVMGRLGLASASASSNNPFTRASRGPHLVSPHIAPAPTIAALREHVAEEGRLKTREKQETEATQRENAELEVKADFGPQILEKAERNELVAMKIKQQPATLAAKPTAISRHIAPGQAGNFYSSETEAQPYGFSHLNGYAAAVADLRAQNREKIVFVS
jgi:hypothetical protein